MIDFWMSGNAKGRSKFASGNLHRLFWKAEPILDLFSGCGPGRAR
jgi:hypothetical protein